MIPELTTPPEFLVALVGSPEAQDLVPHRPDLAECSACKQPVWVDSDHLAGVRKSGLTLICVNCFDRCPF